MTSKRVHSLVVPILTHPKKSTGQCKATPVYANGALTCRSLCIFKQNTRVGMNERKRELRFVGSPINTPYSPPQTFPSHASNSSGLHQYTLVYQIREHARHGIQGPPHLGTQPPLLHGGQRLRLRLWQVPDPVAPGRAITAAACSHHPIVQQVPG
jgi:hypothetical protein